jgi:23S rRNA pseudouridine1911/1915/1917 synthase
MIARPRDIDEDWIPLEFVVRREHAGWRADIFISHQIPRLSRTRVKRILSRSAFDETGRRVKPNRAVREGERITVFRPPPEEPNVPRHFGVLYEDSDLLVIDKPAGLPVHPTARYHKNTLTALLRERFGETPPLLAHRIDSETSGALILAKTKPAERQLKIMFARREVKKRYLAIVSGVPEPLEGRIEVPLGPDKAGPVRVKMAPDPEGLLALTEYRVLEALGDAALVECRPRTGRQHQIRAHLAHLGHPIIGDKMYGEDVGLFLEYIEQGPTKALLERAGAPRHFLHAASISFTHPTREKPLKVESPLPGDMAAYLAAR